MTGAGGAAAGLGAPEACASHTAFLFTVMGGDGRSWEQALLGPWLMSDLIWPRGLSSQRLSHAFHTQGSSVTRHLRRARG